MIVRAFLIYSSDFNVCTDKARICFRIQTYFDYILSKYQCGFRKGFNAQHCLVSIIEKWKESVDNGGAFGALMTDLSKAFDRLHHGLLIAKLIAKPIVLI